MSHQNPDAFLAEMEKPSRFSLAKMSKFSWIAGAVISPLILVPGTAFDAGVFVALMALFGFHCGQIAQGEFRPAPAEFALAVWLEWMRRESEYEQGNGSLWTLKMRLEICQIYENDPRGETFPLRQAFRLIDTYGRQQSRLQVVESHLKKLRQARHSLIEKTAQLRALGDVSRDVSTTLSRVEADVPALETLADEIRASCLRLESLLISVRTSAQVKQLHQELDELASSVAPESQIAVPQFDDLGGIEAQISREVETFLRLERDTDAHLRQL